MNPEFIRTSEEVGDWFSDSVYDWEKNQYKKDYPVPTDIEVLAAYYTYEDYTGDCTVYFRQDGKLYYAGGSHCSCNGLEGQWSPDEIDLPYLKMLLNAGSFEKKEYYDTAPSGFHDHMQAVVEKLESE